MIIKMIALGKREQEKEEVRLEEREGWWSGERRAVTGQGVGCRCLDAWVAALGLRAGLAGSPLG